MTNLAGRSRLLYLSVGFFTGILFLTSCGGGSTAISAIIGKAVEVMFDDSTSTLGANNVQSAIEELNTKADVNEETISSLSTRISTNEADITANETSIAVNAAAITDINYRQRKHDFEASSLAITNFDQDISTGLSLNVENTDRKFLLTASLNVNNTVDQSSPHDTTLRFDLRANNTVRRTETLVLKENSRHIVNIHWLEDWPSAGPLEFDVIVNAQNRVNLEQRHLFVIEL